jgi:hypothetical protein
VTHHLVKNGQLYAFTYQPGDEPAVMRALVETVNNPLVDFDWFDAAVISFKVSAADPNKVHSLFIGHEQVPHG